MTLEKSHRWLQKEHAHRLFRLLERKSFFTRNLRTTKNHFTMINSDKIIGIMGGTFNPIHKGHTGIARCAYEQSDIDEILFMPSGTPAYKDNSPIVSATDRCNMVKLAIKPFDYMSLSTIETDRPGNTYTADTLAQIYDSYKKYIL